VPRGRSRPRADALDLPLVALDPQTGLRVPGFHPRLSGATPSGMAAGRGRVYVGLTSADSSVSRLPARGVAAFDVRTGALDRRFRGPDIPAPTQLVLRGGRLHVNTVPRRAGITTLDARTGRRDPSAGAHASGELCVLATAGGRLYAGGDFASIGAGGPARFAAFR
jgi:hypothetical protein